MTQSGQGNRALWISLAFMGAFHLASGCKLQPEPESASKKSDCELKTLPIPVMYYYATAESLVAGGNLKSSTVLQDPEDPAAKEPMAKGYVSGFVVAGNFVTSPPQAATENRFKVYVQNKEVYNRNCLLLQSLPTPPIGSKPPPKAIDPKKEEVPVPDDDEKDAGPVKPDPVPDKPEDALPRVGVQFGDAVKDQKYLENLASGKCSHVKITGNAVPLQLKEQITPQPMLDALKAINMFPAQFELLPMGSVHKVVGEATLSGTEYLILSRGSVTNGVVTSKGYAVPLKDPAGNSTAAMMYGLLERSVKTSSPTMTFNTFECLSIKKDLGNAFKLKSGAAPAKVVRSKSEFISGLVLPVPNFIRIFNPFANTVTYMCGNMHNAIDFEGQKDSPVVAAADGTVDYIGPIKYAQAGSGRGMFNIILRHVIMDFPAPGENPIYTAYNHSSRLAAGIKPGTQVKAGDTIAYLGKEGFADVYHLHFEMVFGPDHSYSDSPGCDHVTESNIGSCGPVWDNPFKTDFCTYSLDASGNHPNRMFSSGGIFDLQTAMEASSLKKLSKYEDQLSTLEEW